MARTHEATNDQLQSFKAENAVQLQAVRGPCKFCVRVHEPRQCPAWQKICRRCNLPNHFPKSTLCKGDISVPSSPPTASTSAKKSGRGRKRPQNKQMRAMRAESNEEDPPLCSVLLASMSAEATSMVSVTLKMEETGKNVAFCLDSGAQLNIIPQNLLPPGAKLDPPVPVSLYDSTPLQSKGRVILLMKNAHSGKRYRVLCSVVEQGMPILGLNTMMKMN